MRISLLITAAALCGALCSCGHNAIIFDKGVGFRAGIDPEHLSADFPGCSEGHSAVFPW